MSTDWNKQTVAQLKAELTKRGLDTTGKKAELVERIEQSLAAEEGANGDGAEEEMEGQEAAAEGEEAVDEDALLAEDGKEEAAEGEGEGEEEMEAEGDQEEEAAAEGEETEAQEGEEAEEEKKEEIPEEPLEPDQDKIIRETEVPDKVEMRKDRTREMRFRRVFVWPVSESHLESDLFKTYMRMCVFFTFRALKVEDGAVVNGSIEMQFISAAKAAEAAEKLKELGEGIETKQLAPADTEESIRDIKGEKAEEVTDRLLYVSNLPEDVTDEAVEALFPGAQYVLVSRDREESRKCQGYGYVEYDNAASSMEALLAFEEDVTIEENKISLCHYGHQLVCQGNADIPEEKRNVECPMESEDWWYFVKVLRCLKKRLYKDVKNMNMIEKKTFFKRLNTVNSKFEDDKKAREEKSLPAKNLPADLQNKAKGQKRPRTFSGGNYRGGKQPRRGNGRPPSLMEVGRGGRGAPAARGGYNNRNAMNLLMGIEQMLRQSPRGGPRGATRGAYPPRGGYGGGYSQGGYDSYAPRGGYAQGGAYGGPQGGYRKPMYPRGGRGGGAGPQGGRRW